MKTFFTFFIVLMSLTSFAQRFDWVSFTPSPNYSSNGSGGLSTTTDSEGNIYNVATFISPIIVGEDTLNHTGNLYRPDILITKWNSAGEVLNYRHIANWSSNGNPDPQQLLFDEENGEVLLTISSYYNGMQITLWGNDTEADTLLSLAQGAVLRFTTDLSFVSKKNIPGGTSYGTAAAVKDSCLYTAHGYNSIISKTDTAGTVLWSLTPTGTTYAIFDLAVSEDNFVYVMGHYHSNQSSHNGVTLGGITAMPPSAGNNSQVIIFKLDTAGTVLQGYYLAEAQYGLPPIRITTDLEGNVFAAIPYAIGGQTIGTHTLSNPTGANDGFVVKLNNQLEPQWVTELHHSGGNMEMRDIVVNPSGKVMVVGHYGANATMGGFQFAFAQYGSGFLAQLDNESGDILYATNYGSLGAGTGRPFSVTNVDDKYYITGLSFGSSHGNPNWTASYGCYTETRASAYLTCFNDVPFASPTVELVYGSVSLIASTNVDGASYQWFLNGEQLEGETGSSIVPSVIGIYEVVVSSYGCSTSDTYTLECLPTSGTDIVSACNGYTWIDGITYTSNNSSATHLLTSSLGCDSLVTLNLTIEQISDVVTVSGSTLSAAQNNAEYLWLDCDAKLTVIPNETSQTFTPTQNGRYAVQVITGECNVISECVEITTVSLNDYETHSSINIYPNPANDYIVLVGIKSNAKLIITDLSGRIVFETIVSSNRYSIDTSRMNAGVYNVRIESNEHGHCEQIIISK